MKFLLINTCGAEGVAALADEQGVLVEEALPGRGASEALLPAVQRLLAVAGLRVGELDAVAVVVGPGSFTGVRVGLSASKGICDGAGLKMVALSRLELLAGGDGVAVLDAGRGEFFCGVYRAGVMVREELLSDHEVGARIGPATAVTCEAGVGERLGIPVKAEPGAAAMLASAERRAAAGQWSDIALTDANYLRRTDAELLVEGRKR